jgi:hypothetical protein
MMGRPPSEVLAVDEFHREKVPAVDLSDVVDAADVGMGHLPGDAHLGEQPLAPHGIVCKRLGQEFQRHGLSQFEIVRSIDFPHPTAAKQSDDTVSVGEDRSGRESSGGDGVGRNYPGNVWFFRRRFLGFRRGRFCRGHLGKRAESFSTGVAEAAPLRVLRRALRALPQRWRSHRNSENVSDYMRCFGGKE